MIRGFCVFSCGGFVISFCVFRVGFVLGVVVVVLLEVVGLVVDGLVLEEFVVFCGDGGVWFGVMVAGGGGFMYFLFE